MCILIVKILFLIVIILIALLLIIFSESLYISVALKNNNLSYLGVISIKYYFLQVVFDIKTRQINLLITSKYFTKEIYTRSIGESSENISTGDESSDDDSDSTEMDDEHKYDIKELIKLLNNAKREILQTVALIIDSVSFKNSYILMNLGLGDNNLTIKTCNKIWAITAPFYTIGLQTILTPELNKTILKTESNILFEIGLLKIFKLIIKVLSNKNLRQIIEFFIKS